MFEETKNKYEKLIFHLIHKYQLTYDFDEFYQMALIKLWELDQSYDSNKTSNKDHYVYTKLKFFFIDEIRKLSKRNERFILMNDDIMYHSNHFNDSYDHLTLKEIKHYLSREEYQWLTLFLKGYSMKEIADEMKVSVSTIKKYKKNAQKKLTFFYHNH